MFTPHIRLNSRQRQVAMDVGMAGRIWDGQSMVFDEAYQILMDLSILTEPGKAGDSKSKGQNPRAGWFNKYLGVGVSNVHVVLNRSSYVFAVYHRPSLPGRWPRT